VDSPSLARRAVAALVLVVAAWILFRIVLGFVMWLATVAAVVLAVVALLWAVQTLRR
jgi:accessory gene regulator protein AgrB